MVESNFILCSFHSSQLLLMKIKQANFPLSEVTLISKNNQPVFLLLELELFGRFKHSEQIFHQNDGWPSSSRRYDRMICVLLTVNNNR